MSKLTFEIGSTNSLQKTKKHLCSANWKEKKISKKKINKKKSPKDEYLQIKPLYFTYVIRLKDFTYL